MTYWQAGAIIEAEVLGSEGRLRVKECRVTGATIELDHCAV